VGVLLPKTVAEFRSLLTLRNRSIHFNVSTYSTLRGDALAAIHDIREIIDQQFTAFGNRAWFIMGLEVTSLSSGNGRKTTYQDLLLTYVPVRRTLLPPSRLLRGLHFMIMPTTGMANGRTRSLPQHLTPAHLNRQITYPLTWARVKKADLSGNGLARLFNE
jgi:hypothetical protein